MNARIARLLTAKYAPAARFRLPNEQCARNFVTAYGGKRELSEPFAEPSVPLAVPVAFGSLSSADASHDLLVLARSRDPHRPSGRSSQTRRLRCSRRSSVSFLVSPAQLECTVRSVRRDDSDLAVSLVSPVRTLATGSRAVSCLGAAQTTG